MDSYKEKASLKMSFLQAMVETEHVDPILIQEAFDEALDEYVMLEG